MNRYTYRWIDPKTWKPGVKPVIRFTRGTFAGWTAPMGLANVPYAMFRNRSSELFIPIYDLTPETKAKIGPPPQVTA